MFLQNKKCLQLQSVGPVHQISQRKYPSSYIQKSCLVIGEYYKKKCNCTKIMFLVRPKYCLFPIQCLHLCLWSWIIKKRGEKKGGGEWKGNKRERTEEGGKEKERTYPCWLGKQFAWDLWSRSWNKFKIATKLYFICRFYFAPTTLLWVFWLRWPDSFPRVDSKHYILESMLRRSLTHTKKLYPLLEQSQ